MIELAVKRGDPLSAKFVKRFAPHLISALAVPAQARGRIHDQEGFRKAAVYRAANPKASWTNLARAVGVKPSTVRQWEQSAEFKSLVRDAELQNSLGPPKWELHQELMREVEALEPKKKSRRPGKIGFRILRPVRPKKF
jgi:transposase-like protein